MELSNLIFKVDTSQLEKAVKTIEQVGQATEDLAKNIQNLSRAEKQAADASTASAKARQENAKATTAELKAAEAQASAAEKAAKATRDLGKSAEETGSKLSAAEKLVEKMNLRQQVLARGTIELNNEVVNLGRGFTSGQAAMIASLKQLGGGADMIRELATTLKQYNDITGVNPFDKAIGGMRKLTQEARELQLSSDLSAKGFALTKDQVQILARDLQALTSVYKQNGASQDYVNRAIDVVTKRFIRKAEVVNRLNAEVKENERAAKAQGNAAINAAKATSFIERELARAENALQGLNEQLYISTSNRLLKFQQSLAASNLPMEQQIALMERYKKTLAETDAQRRKQNTTDSNRQVDLLARSLAPQISDVAVSLAGGMNPFTVLMQQGLQVRDLMQLSGVEAERMGEAFRKAGAGMVSTSVAAAGAIGSMLGGAILDLGASITRTAIKISGMSGVIENMRYQMTLMKGSTENLLPVIGRVGLFFANLIPAAIGASVVAFGAALVGLGVGLYQVIKQENELAKVLALNSANLNMSQQAAISYAQSFNAVETSTSKVISVLTEMAKAGSFSKNELDMVVASAIQMEKYAGVAIGETVKSFSKIKEKPVEAILELARSTGMVSPAVQQMIIELQNSGRTAEATALAVKTLADVNNQQVSRMKEDYNGFSLFIKELGSDISNFFSSVFKDLFYKADPVKMIQGRLDYLKAQTGVFAVGGFLGVSKDEVTKLEEQLSLLKKARGQEEERLRISAENAKLNLDAQKAYESSLSTEQKYKKTIESIDKNIQKARTLGNQKAVEAFEQQRRYEEKLYKEKKDKENRKPKTESQKLEDSLRGKEFKAYEALTDAAIKAEVAARNYSDVQKAALDIFASPEWNGYVDSQGRLIQYTDAQKVAIAAKVEEMYKEEQAYKALLKVEAEREELRKRSFENDAKAMDLLVDYEIKMRDSIDALKEESDELQFQAGLIGLVDSERKKAIESRKIEIEYQKELNRISALGPSVSQADKDALSAQALQKRNLQLKNLNTSIANDLNQKMVDGVTDAIMTGLLEGGEAGKKKLRDLIVAELQKPVKMFIQATVSNIFGLNGGQQGGGVNWLEMAGKAWDWFSGGSTASAASSLGSAAGSGFGVTTTGSGFGVTATGSGLTTSAVTKTAAEVGMQAGSAAGTSAGTAAAAVPVVGWIAAAVMVANSMYKKGYNRTALGVGEGEKKTYGRFSSTSGRTDLQQSAHYKYSAENAARGLLDGLGLSKKWADIFSGTVRMAHLFGRRLKGYGYQADVRGSDVNVSGYEYYKGGVFRSNKTVTTAVDSRDAENLKQEIERVRSASKGMALALGGSTEAIDAFSGSVKINFKGAETAAEQQERLADGLLQLELEMINAATGANMTKESLKALKEETANLAQQAGYSAEQITSTLVAGMTGKMTESEVGAALGDIIVGSIYNSLAMGFAEQITGAITGLIIQPIMTAVLTGGSVTAAVSQASMDAVLATATKAINAFNQIISTAEFKDFIGKVNNLVGGIAKISVKPAANVRSFGSAMQSAGNAAAEAAKKIADERYQLEGKLLDMLNQTAKLRQRELNALHPSNRALQMHIYALEDAKNAYDAVVDAVNETLDKSKELRDKIKGIFDLLVDQIRELRGEVEDPAEMQRQEAQRFLDGVISSGVLPDQEDLSKAIDALRSGIVDENFQSEVEAARERLTLANTLDQIKVLADKDLKKVEQDILLLEQQLKVAQDQMNALLGIQTYTYNTEQAVIALQAAIGDYAKAFNNALSAVAGALTSAPSSGSSGGGGGGGRSGGGGSTSKTGNSKTWTAEGYWNKNTDLQTYWNENRAALERDQRFNQNPEVSARDEYLAWHWANYGSKPSENRKFAKGGAFTNGIVQSPTRFNIGEMGEAGPEAILPLVNVGGSLGVRAVSGDSDTSKQLEMLSTAVMQLTIATNKMQRQFDNARGEDGTSLNVTIVNTSSNPVPTNVV